MPPTYGNGKICYLDIPAGDVEASAAFYEKVFGWELRRRGDGAIAFDDAVMEVSGTWSTGRPPASSGILIYIMVDSVEDACAAVEAHGGRITQAIGADHPEITARFADPYGNVLGLYQQPA